MLFICIALLFFLHLLISFNESDLFDDGSDDDGYDSGSAGKCNFPFCFDESVACVGDSVVCVG